jgi:hypothetical protein
MALDGPDGNGPSGDPSSGPGEEGNRMRKEDGVTGSGGSLTVAIAAHAMATMEVCSFWSQYV